MNWKSEGGCVHASAIISFVSLKFCRLCSRRVDRANVLLAFVFAKWEDVSCVKMLFKSFFRGKKAFYHVLSFPPVIYDWGASAKHSGSICSRGFVMAEGEIGSILWIHALSMQQKYLKLVCKEQIKLKQHNMDVRIFVDRFHKTGIVRCLLEAELYHILLLLR